MMQAGGDSAVDRMFNAADVDGDGYVSMADMENFRRYYQEVDTNADGTISHAEFVPLMYDWMVEALKMGFMSRDLSELERYLLDMFEAVSGRSREDAPARQHGARACSLVGTPRRASYC